MEPLFKMGVRSHLNKNLGLWMQIMDAYGKREKTALGGCSHACFLVSGRSSGILKVKMEGESSHPLRLGHALRQKKWCCQAKEGSLYAKGLDS